MPYRLGVDLGTTFTAAAVDDGTAPAMIGLGSRLALAVPSVLFLAEDGFVVGETAERRGAQMPDRLAREFKRRLGDHVPLIVAGSPFSAELLTARLLQWVVARAAQQSGEPPDEVILTHPANWGPYKMEVLGQVIELADIGPTSWCPEPVAAAVQYASRSPVADGTLLAVYDFGGGTFDACVLEKSGRDFTMVGTPDGVEHLGGVDLNEALFRLVLDSLVDQVGNLDADDTDVKKGLARLRRECVTAKEDLSEDADAVIDVSLPGISTTFRVTRGEFEALIRPAVEETVRALRRTLRSGSVDPSALDRIVLIGGSSQIPLVTEMLQREFDVVPAVDTHPKHDVALGALRLNRQVEASASSTSPPVVPPSRRRRRAEKRAAEVPRLPPVPRAAPAVGPASPVAVPDAADQPSAPEDDTLPTPEPIWPIVGRRRAAGHGRRRTARIRGLRHRSTSGDSAAGRRPPDRRRTRGGHRVRPEAAGFAVGGRGARRGAGRGRCAGRRQPESAARARHHAGSGTIDVRPAVADTDLPVTHTRSGAAVGAARRDTDDRFDASRRQLGSLPR